MGLIGAALGAVLSPTQGQSFLQNYKSNLVQGGMGQGAPGGMGSQALGAAGAPQNLTQAISQGFGRKTPKQKRPDPYTQQRPQFSLGGSRGYQGGLVSRESALSEPGPGGNPYAY